MNGNGLKTQCVGLSFAIFFVLSACSGGEDESSPAGAPSNMARFTFDCNLQGLIGELTMDIEIIQSSGIIWGPGSDPEITAVVGTGEVTYYTSGALRSPTAYYIFTGENQFADFTETTTKERFRVRWVEEEQGLTIIINPFGPGPTQHFCQMTSAQFL